jgi:hypothetical protein
MYCHIMVEESPSGSASHAPPLGGGNEVRRFADFWPLYLHDHRRPLTRLIHVFGTATGLALVIAGAVVGPWLASCGIAVGYGFAWFAHLAVERNRPATFRHPLWSFLADLRMTTLFLAGRLEGELRRYGVEASRSPR